MPTPAHHQMRIAERSKHIGVAQNVEYRIGDSFGRVGVELRVAVDLVADKNHIAQHGEQMLLDALDHLAVDEGAGRRTLDVEFDAALALDDADVKSLIALQQLLAVV